LPTSPKPPGTKTIFLGNLPFDIDEETIRRVFGEVGDIAEVRWVERDGWFKGCGFIEFTNTEATDKAVAMNGQLIRGRPVHVDYSNDRGQYTSQSQSAQS